MVQTLKDRGCRMTPQRMAVLRVLAESEDHLSADQIYRQIKVDLPTTSLATVYKTLELLKDVGQVLELRVGEGGSRYDGLHVSPHPHLICTSCGEILDLEIDVPKEIPLRVMEETGYKIVNHRLDFYGLCQKCQATHTDNTS
jgi:Fur family peroxide stress response transcriptional regulator